MYVNVEGCSNTISKYNKEIAVHQMTWMIMRQTSNPEGHKREGGVCEMIIHGHITIKK